jgi:hypothetical protein
MAKTGITGPGLWCIAIVVAALWACILTERFTVRRANLGVRRTLGELQALQVRVHGHLKETPPVRKRARHHLTA